MIEARQVEEVTAKVPRAGFFTPREGKPTTNVEIVREPVYVITDLP